MLKAIAISGLLSLLMLGTTLSVIADQTDLYQATTIVTGRENSAERERGTREAFEIVMARLCAD